MDLNRISVFQKQKHSKIVERIVTRGSSFGLNYANNRINHENKLL